MMKHTLQKCLIALSLAIAGVDAQITESSSPRPDALAPADESGFRDTLPAPGNVSDTVDVAPQLTTFVNAAYPKECILGGIEGVVVMDLLVDTTGRVDSVALVNGVHPALDSTAQRAARAFLFSPARSAGQPVAVLLRYAYRFTLSDQAAGFENRVNLSGIVYEKGTRTPIANATVAVNLADSLCKVKQSQRRPALDAQPCGIPLRNYRELLGKLDGQKLEQDQLVTQTDSLGRFVFRALPGGTVGVRLLVPGYKPWNEPVVIKPQQETMLQIFASNLSYNEYEVVVYGSNESVQVEHREISSQEIRRVAGFNGEAVKVLQAMPGVARPQFGQSEIIIRGSDNDQSKVLFDGIEIPYLYHAQKMDSRQLLCRSIFNSDALRSVTLYPGGVGVEHGNFLGGVVDLTSRPARTDRFHATLDVNLMGYSLLLESPIAKNVSAIASVRGSLASYLMRFVADKFFHEKMTMVDDNLDFSLRVDYTPAAGHRIFAEAIGAKDTISFSEDPWVTGRTLDKDELLYGFGRKFLQGIGGWDWTINPSLGNTVRLGLRKQYYRDFNNMNEGWTPSLLGSETTYDVKEALTWKVHPALSATAGVDIHATPGNLYNTFTVGDTTFRDTLDETLGHYGVYLKTQWQPVDKLTLTAGLRFDRYPQLSYSGANVPEFWNYDFSENTTRFSGDPSVRFSAKYILFPKHTLTASAGTYSQSPDSVLFQIFSKKNITSVKGSQYTLGYRWQCTDLHSVEVSGYYNQQWDRFRFTTSEERVSQSDDFTSIDWWKCDGRARMEGFEVLLRREHGKRFSGWLGYSLGYSERFDEHGKKWAVYDYNVLNNVQAVGEWALPRNHSVGFRMQYTEGYPYTPYTSEFYNATGFMYIARAGKKNSERYPPYVGIDINYSKKWVLKHSLVTTYIELLNLAHWLQFIDDKEGNPLYQPSEMYRYSYDYSTLEGQAMIPLASFGIKWEF